MLINYNATTHFSINFYFLLSLKLDKKTKQDIKDHKRKEEAHEGREKYLNKLKENISNEEIESGNASNDATDATSSATNSTASAITRSSDVYIYGFGLNSVPAIGA